MPVDSTLRAPDWIESKETADQLMQDDFFDSLSTATEQMHQASIAGGYEPHLKGLPTPADVTSWYCRRTCEIDALSGQIHNSILLLEAATQRGVTSDELLSLLMQARSLSRLLSSSDPSPLSTSSWEMSLDCFHTLEAHEQLLLMLSYGSVLASRAEDEHDCEEEDYDEEWIERVVGDKRIESEAMELSLAIKEHGYPFLSSVPGLDRASLLLSLCKTQLESRPSWLRTLVWAEARRISLTTHQGLFSSSLDLAKTVETCIRDSAIHGDPDILMQCLACCIWSLDQLGSDDESKEPRDSIKSLLLLLRAGKVMEKRGVPGALLSPFALSNGQRAASEQILDALLSDSSRASWKERDWRLLWADVDLLCTHGALPGISAQEAFSEMLRSVLDCGQTSLAASLISASQQMGGRSIMDGALVRPPKLEDDRLINIIADTASRLLTTSPSLDDQDTTSAAELLSLLPEPLLNVPRPLPPALRLLRALPRIKKLLDIVPSPQNYDDLVPVCLVEDIAKGGPELLVQRMLDVFSSSTGARLHRQVDELVDVALAVGSSDQSSEEEVRSSILFLAASAATSAGDLKAGLSLTLKLASLRYSPAATLAATLGMEQPDEGSDQETRFKLLSFAASHCDTGALPQLLEELAAVGTRRIEAQGLASEPPIDPTSPSALLAHALPLLQHVPTRGWWELMVATLLQPLADDATSFVLSHLSDKSYSDTQRLIYAGIFANSLRAFFCLDSLSSIDEIRQVCCLSPSDITSSAKKMLISASSDNLSPKLKEVARDCLQAADSLLLHLKGVEDGRSVRLSLGPLANQSGSEASAASAFVSGDKTTVRAAILQQARRAGQQVMVELEEHGTAEASMKVLGESIALGLSYDAAEEVECRSEYLMTLIQTCKQSDGPLPAHMRSQALGQVDTMLAIQENSSEKTAALLAHSLALNVWTKIPPSSHHHISTILLTLSKCAASLSIKENSLGKDLDKVVILIDKAWGSGSLKGLDARSILTPLLRPHITSCLSPLINMQAGQEILMPDTSHDHSSGLLSLGDEKDDTLQSLSVEAQAAVFSFSTSPSSAASASKLLKVLQSLLPPSRATSALPPSLPYLSLLLQATTTNTNGEIVH